MGSPLLLILALAGKSKLILRLSVWNLVNTEPFVRSSQETWKVPLNVLNIIKLCCQGIIDINDNYFPIGFFLVKQGHDSKDLDLLDLTRCPDKLANFADIQGIIIPFSFSLRMNDIWVFPGLQLHSKSLW